MLPGAIGAVSALGPPFLVAALISARVRFIFRGFFGAAGALSPAFEVFTCRFAVLCMAASAMWFSGRAFFAAGIISLGRDALARQLFNGAQVRALFAGAK